MRRENCQPHTHAYTSNGRHSANGVWWKNVGHIFIIKQVLKTSDETFNHQLMLWQNNAIALVDETYELEWNMFGLNWILDRISGQNESQNDKFSLLQYKWMGNLHYDPSRGESEYECFIGETELFWNAMAQPIDIYNHQPLDPTNICFVVFSVRTLPYVISRVKLFWKYLHEHAIYLV